MEKAVRKRGVGGGLTRKNGVAPKEEGLILDDSGSNCDEVLGLEEEKVGLVSGENGVVLSAGEDDGSEMAMKEERVGKVRDNAVEMNKRVLRSDVKKEEGVRIENGVIQFPSERRKNRKSCEARVSPESTVTPLDVEIADNQDLSGVANEEVVQPEKKKNVADSNERILRFHFNRKEKDDNNETSVFQLQVQRKKRSEPADALISRVRTKVMSGAETPLGIDSSKINKDKLNKEKGEDHADGIELQMKKRMLRSDVIKHKEVSDIEDVIKSQVDKRIRKSLDTAVCGERMKTPLNTEVSLKKIKIGSPKFQLAQAEGCKVEKVSNDTWSQGDAKEPTMSSSLCITNAASESNAAIDDQKDIGENDKEQDENINWMERSDTRIIRMLNERRNAAGTQRGESSLTQKKDRSLREQGKGGVLKVSPMDGLENFHPRRRKGGQSNALATPTSAARDASKQSSLSVEGKVHGKPSSATIVVKKLSNRNHQSSNGKKIFKNSKREPEDISAAGGLRKRKISTGSTVVKGTSSFGSKSLLSSKRKSNNYSIRTAKQNLRDQLQSILLDAGWKIDLRPRKSRDYLDAVYIPPDRRGSYWSITKAYTVYQEKYNTAGAEKRTKTGKAKKYKDNSMEGSNSIIPLDSLSMLRRITSKRRNKLNVEEVIMHKKRKDKDISYKTTPKKYGSMKANQIKRRKRLDDSLGSDSHVSFSSTTHKHVRTRKNKHLLARGSNHEAECEDFVPYAWKSTILSWMIDLGVLPINGKVKYMNNRKTKVKLEGWIKRDGIQCSCCNKIVPISTFELHTGNKVLQASENIHVEGPGVSLLQCQLDAWKKQDISERQGFFEIDVTGEDPNDDTCGICGDGGDLICCDSCPSTFHLSCLGIEILPPGDWNCTNCSCRFCRVVSISDAKESDGTSPLISCSQCEQKYHLDCVPVADSVHTDEKNSDASFCGQNCMKVFMQLDKLIATKNSLQEGFSWSFIRRFDEDSSESAHSKAKRAECNSKIAVALAVMDECFLPITDQRSGVDMIRNVVYNCGSNFSRLNYTGFYTFVLERDDEIISAASVRFHGTQLAEMPFIGTRHSYRRQGMARKLLNGIETLLCSLNVEKLVIPAISELRDTWTNAFGFRSPKNSEEIEFRSINLLVFPGIGLLQKPLLENGSTARKELADLDLSDRFDQDQSFNFSHVSPKVSILVPNLNSPIKCLSDDLLDSGANVSPKSIDDPDQFEVAALEYKSSELDGDKNVNDPRAAVNHDSSVAEVQVKAESSMGTYQLLCEMKGNSNDELKSVENCESLHEFHNTLLENVSDSKCMAQFCGNSISHESETVESQTRFSDLVQRKSKQPQSYFIGSICQAGADLTVRDNHEVSVPASHVTSEGIVAQIANM